jgi:hypothetical protein
MRLTMIGTAAGEAVSVETLTTPQRRLVDLIRNHPGLFRAQTPNKMLFRFQWVPGCASLSSVLGNFLLGRKTPRRKAGAGLSSYCIF